MIKIYGVAVATAILVSGCGGNTAKEIQSDVKEINTTEKHIVQKKLKLDDNKSSVVKKQIKAEKPILKKHDDLKPNAQVSKFYQIFKDSAKISTDGKEMLLLFGQNGDAYTDKIKNDIVSDDTLSDLISETVTPIYVDARGQKKHKFQHNGEMMDVDTKTLVSIYNVTATPTLIFTDREASHIFVVPGYMPKKQFKVTLDFVKQGLWKGKDRKNGDVYKALKEFYIKNGVEIKGIKK